MQQGNWVHQRRKEVGAGKDSWAQHFKKNGYHSARISKIFHMGVPPDITKGSDGADDPESWNEPTTARARKQRYPDDPNSCQTIRVA